MRSLALKLLCLSLLLVGGWRMGLPDRYNAEGVARAEQVRGTDMAACGELRQALPATATMQQPRQTRTLSQNTSERQSSRLLPEFSSAHKARLSHSVLHTRGGLYTNPHNGVRGRLARWYYVIALRRLLC